MAKKDDCQKQEIMNKIVESIKKANEEEKARNYEKALELYSTGIETILISIKSGIYCDKVNALMKEKCKTYLDEAEKLKKLIKESPTHKLERSLKRMSFDQSLDKPNEDSFDRSQFEEIINRHTVDTKNSKNLSSLTGYKAQIEQLTQYLLLPAKLPGLVSAPTNVLIYGPAGCGKTTLMKVMTSELEASVKFFFVNCGELMSTMLNGERIMKELFLEASRHERAIIFLDDIDCLHFDEMNMSRRIRTEFLVQSQNSICKQVQVIAASTQPWLMSPSFMKRFPKCVYMSLPDKETRKELIKQNLDETPNKLNEEDTERFALLTEGYSIADILTVMRDAIMSPIRRLKSTTHFKLVTGPSRQDPNQTVNDLLAPCTADDPDAIEMSLMDVPSDKLIEMPVMNDDLQRSLKNILASISQEEMKKFNEFHDRYTNRSI